MVPGIRIQSVTEWLWKEDAFHPCAAPQLLIIARAVKRQTHWISHESSIEVYIELNETYCDTTKAFAPWQLKRRKWDHWNNKSQCEIFKRLQSVFSVIFGAQCHMFSSHLLNCCSVWVNGGFVFLGLVTCQGQCCLSHSDCQGRLERIARQSWKNSYLVCSLSSRQHLYHPAAFCSSSFMAEV